MAKAIYANNKQAPLSLINFQIITFDEKYGVYLLKLHKSEQQLFALPSAVEQGNKLILECEQISVSAEMPLNTNNSNVLICTLHSAELIDKTWQLTLDVDGQSLYCLLSPRVWDQNNYKVGDTLYATIHNLE